MWLPLLFLPRDAMLAQYMLLSVCHKSWVLQSRLNLGSHNERHTIAKRLHFSVAKNLDEIPKGSPTMGATNRGGVGSSWQFATLCQLDLSTAVWAMQTDCLLAWEALSATDTFYSVNCIVSQSATVETIATNAWIVAIRSTIAQQACNVPLHISLHVTLMTHLKTH